MRYGKSQVADVLPVIDTAQYTAGDVLGTLDDSAAGAGVSFIQLGNQFAQAVLKDLTVLDNANQKAALSILFFSDLPTGTYTNNNALSFAAGDLAKIVAKVNIVAADYETIGGKAVAQVQPSIVLRGADKTRKVYVVVVTTGTPTYTAATDLRIRNGLILD